METSVFEPKIGISNEDFMKKGYYIGNISEIIENVGEFEKLKNVFIENNKNEKGRFRYRYEYTNFTPLVYNHQIKVEEIEERRKLIEENGYKTIQKWYEFCSQFQDDYIDVVSVIKSSINKFIPKIYPDLENRMNFTESITLYENGDFIEPHIDHVSEERYCVVLLYLSDEQNYNDGGAELLVGVGDQNELVKPLFGTYVILDFKENGVLHAVEETKNNFQRFTYINFISIKSDEQIQRELEEGLEKIRETNLKNEN